MLQFADAAGWEAWLVEHHADVGGAWLKIARKGSALDLITIGQALEVALCYGWIDSQRKSCDEHCYLQRYSRRRPRSPWSRENVERAEMLISAGRMRPPGLAQVTEAQADGRWAVAYSGQRDATVPPELADALAACPLAGERFLALDKTARYLMMLPLLKASTQASRARAIERVVVSLTRGN